MKKTLPTPSLPLAVIAACALLLSVGACSKGNATQEQPPPAPGAPQAGEGEAAAEAAEGEAAGESQQGSQGEAAAEAAEAATTAEIGKLAPDFELADTEGKTFRLSDHRGKTVVLEWFNPECPFVVHAYEQGPLNELVASRTGENLVWVHINSGADGEQGTGVEKNRGYQERWKLPHAVLIDEPGKVGRMYEARTTPHMYVINPEGVLVYRGGVDNAPRGRVRGGGELQPYLAQALDDLAANRPIATPDTEPYGCTVKYR